MEHAELSLIGVVASQGGKVKASLDKMKAFIKDRGAGIESYFEDGDRVFKITFDDIDKESEHD